MLCHDTSHAVLEKFCEEMPHIKKLKLPSKTHPNRYVGVLRAISANMHYLRSLDISGCPIEPKAIECLLPTEDNSLGGCPELVELDLWQTRSVGVELLKKIILALPKLRSLIHELLVDALGALTEEEMGVDTARCLNCLYAGDVYRLIDHGYFLMRYHILIKSPVFQRLSNSITTVNIQIRHVGRQKEPKLLADVLKLLPNLKHLKLCGVLNTKYQVLPLLESIGDRLVSLSLDQLSGNLSLSDVMRTCPNLVKLTLCELRHFKDDSLNNDSSIHHDQADQQSNLPALNFLDNIYLQYLDEDVCSADMLVALLQFPNLNKIRLVELKALSDDVMWNVFSSRGCAALSKVTEFTVMSSLVTAAPLAHWITTENCSLQYMEFCECEQVDYDVIRAAAERCHGTLIVIESY